MTGHDGKTTSRTYVVVWRLKIAATNKKPLPISGKRLFADVFILELVFRKKVDLEQFNHQTRFLTLLFLSAR
jgi:hypothetical protein